MGGIPAVRALAVIMGGRHEKPGLRGPYLRAGSVTIPESGVEFIGARMAAHRYRWGLTLTEASKDMGISVGTLCSIETGRVTPSLEKLIIIATYYGVPIEKLTGTETGARTKGNE